MSRPMSAFFADLAGNVFAGISGNQSWNFTLASPAVPANEGSQNTTTAGNSGNTPAAIPAAVSKLRSENPAADSVSLRWEPVAAADFIRLFRRMPDGSLKLIAVLDGKMTAFIDKDVTANEKYEYYLVAANSFGQSNSVQLSARTAPPVPVIAVPEAVICAGQGYVLSAKGSGNAAEILLVQS